jgi:hypothetical protein
MRQTSIAAYRNVKIALIENSTAGNPPKMFSAQTIGIEHEPDIVQISVDGRRSSAKLPATVLWLEGKAKELQRITDIKIFGSDGAMLLSAAILRTYQAPRDVDGGVEFQVLQA